MSVTDTLDDQLREIRLVALDVDGVLTDGRLLFDSSGIEYKSFNAQDGYGLKRLMDAGVGVAIITGRTSSIVSARAEELGIAYVVQGAIDKGECLSRLIAELGLNAEQSLFVGDDEPDLAAMRVAGIGVAVANAVDRVKDAADWVTRRKGGNAAVREVCERVLAAQS